LTVTTRPLTITADAKTKVYGSADPSFSYQLTSGTLVGTDSISGSLTRVAGESVGSYAIQQGTVGAGSNYSVAYLGANLTITLAPSTDDGNLSVVVTFNGVRKLPAP
jgi:hypothetical protein